ncbi:4,5-dihydroxyphthalate decarboxylase [Streptomyces sp. M19]
MSGDVAVDGYAVEPVEVKPVIGAYRRMIRDLEFDVCELAPTTYLMALRSGIPLTGIPVFLNRRFHHADVRCGAGSGCASRRPHGQADRRPRLHGDHRGVDARPPARRVRARHRHGHLGRGRRGPHRRARPGERRARHGRQVARRAAERRGHRRGAERQRGHRTGGRPRAGWAASAEQPSADDGPYPLFPDHEVLATDWYVRTGIYPLHSVISIRGALVDRDPALPSALYAAFADSKRRQVAADPEWTALPRLGRQARQIGGDPSRTARAPTTRVCARW